MTPKQIVFSDHATEQMRDREIRRSDIRWLLARGDRQMEPTLHGQQRWSCRGYLGNREAKVVFLEDATTIIIVTIMWVY